MKTSRLLQAGWFFFLGLHALAAEPTTSPEGGSKGVIDVLTQDVTRFTKWLKSPNPQRRIEGIQGLAYLRFWPSEPALLSLSRDESFDVGRAAVMALGRLGTAASVPRLIECLDHPSPEIRRHALISLRRLTGRDLGWDDAATWRDWWEELPLEQRVERLLEQAAQPQPPSEPSVRRSPAYVASLPGRQAARRSPPGNRPPADRLQALQAICHLATPAAEPAVIALLQERQAPPLQAEERKVLCDALERIGSTRAIPVLAAERSDAAAWALGRIGGAAAEQALLKFPPSLPTLLALDRLHSTNAGHWVPRLVAGMGLLTYRSQPDDVMHPELQPVQRVSVNLIRRSGLAPLLIDCVLWELERTMQPPREAGPHPERPAAWEPMLREMRPELKPGFVRGDGRTTSQPVAALCYLVEDPGRAKRLRPLLRHPALLVRAYVALALGRLGARQTIPEILEIIDEDYSFSDSVALASGKHFDKSQTIRWRGFLCMALGRMGGEEARRALERRALDPARPRDVRYGAVVGLRLIGSTASRAVLGEVAEKDLIWLVRQEARWAIEEMQQSMQEVCP